MSWLALLLGAALAILEWRRADRRRRALRVLATLATAAALAALSRPQPLPESPLESAVLWTRGADPRESHPDWDAFVLTEGGRTPPGAMPVPDLGTLRRLHPRLRHLEIRGEGLEPGEATRLAGLGVGVLPAPAAAQPGFVALDHPRQVALGQAWTLQGRVETCGQEGLRVRLWGPDGASTELPLQDRAFQVRVPPAPAAGRFVWQLSLQAGDRELTREEFGIAIVPSDLPRVLVLESSPRLDTARLKRWYASLGGSLAAHTQIARQRSRGSELGESKADFAELSAALLAEFDVVISGARTLAALPSAERTVLEAAVRDHGLGLLLLDPASEYPTVSPWQLEPVATAEPGSNERQVRPRWPDRAFEGSESLPAPAAAVRLTSTQRLLLQDAQGRAVAASTALGRGRLGITLLRETWRWLQADEPAAFAAYWSALLTDLARSIPAGGTWNIESEHGPILPIHQPLRLVWRSVDASPPPPAEVTAPDGVTTKLALAQHARHPARWWAPYWPTASGWHRLTGAAGGPVLDFRSDSSAAWPLLRAQTRRDAAAQAAVALRAPSARGPSNRSGHGWFAALAFACLSFLWIESRLLSRMSAAPDRPPNS